MRSDKSASFNPLKLWHPYAAKTTSSQNNEKPEARKLKTR